MTSRNLFKFGFEAEFLVTRSSSYEALWHDDLQCSRLESIFDSISLIGLPSLDGLCVKSLSGELLPYYVEGYDVYDSQGRLSDVLPKGVELRTPISQRPDDAVALLGTLRQRLAKAMAMDEMAIVPLSHHPTATMFSGSRQNRTLERWHWAQEAMFNFALHANVSLPHELQARLDIADLHAKVNFYGPALAAFSAAAPVYDGEIWQVDGRPGKSKRIHRRSKVAPAFCYYPDQGHRLEFKSFDMSCDDADFHAYILLWLALVLDERVAGRSSDDDRRRDMRTASILGLEDEQIYGRSAEVLESAFATLGQWGFETSPLNHLARRLDSRRCPADDVLDWIRNGLALEAIIEYLSVDVCIADSLSPSVSNQVLHTARK